jgi:hypothetical protein
MVIAGSSYLLEPRDRGRVHVQDKGLVRVWVAASPSSARAAAPQPGRYGMLVAQHARNARHKGGHSDDSTWDMSVVNSAVRSCRNINIFHKHKNNSSTLE